MGSGLPVGRPVAAGLGLPIVRLVAAGPGLPIGRRVAAGPAVCGPVAGPEAVPWLGKKEAPHTAPGMPGVMGLEAKKTWWWAKMLAIPVARYLGRGSSGTEMLREEIEAENEGIRIPPTIRWLSGAPSFKARYQKGTIRASSVVLAVADEDTFRLVRKGGLRLQGRRYEVEAYEEVRLDVVCGHCSEWGQIEPQCPRTAASCGW